MNTPTQIGQVVFPTAIQQTELSKYTQKSELQAKYLQRQIQPLSEQNSNLKDYIIASNFYLQSRSKDFCSLLRDSPDRSFLKELGDLSTIYLLVQEDIEYYKNIILKFETDQLAMIQEVLLMRAEKELSSVQCDNVKEQLTQQIQSQKEFFLTDKEQINNINQSQLIDLQVQLAQEQKSFQAKMSECTQSQQMNQAYKKQIHRQHEEFQRELLSMEAVIADQKEKYTRDIRALREKYEIQIKELTDVTSLNTDQVVEDYEVKIKQFKNSWVRSLDELEELRSQLSQLSHIQNRSKSMLDLSQQELRDNSSMISDQIKQLTIQEQILSRYDNDLQTKNQMIITLQVEYQQQGLEFRQYQQDAKIKEFNLTTALNEIFSQIKLMGKSIKLPEIILETLDDTNICIPKLQAIDTKLDQEIQKNSLLMDQAQQFTQDLDDLEIQITLIKEMKQKYICMDNKILKINRKNQVNYQTLRQGSYLYLNCNKKVLKILQQHYQKLLKQIKSENKKQIKEMVGTSTGQKYSELSSEVQVLKNQRQLHNIKESIIHSSEDSGSNLMFSDYSQEELHPKDFAKNILPITENSERLNSQLSQLEEQYKQEINKDPLKIMMCVKCLGNLNADEIKEKDKSLTKIASQLKIQLDIQASLPSVDSPSAKSPAMRQDVQLPTPKTPVIIPEKLIVLKPQQDKDTIVNIRQKQKTPEQKKKDLFIRQIPNKQSQQSQEQQSRQKNSKFKKHQWNEQHDVEVTQVKVEKVKSQRSKSNISQQANSSRQCVTKSSGVQGRVQLLSDFLQNQEMKSEDFQMLERPSSRQSISLQFYTKIQSRPQSTSQHKDSYKSENPDDFELSILPQQLGTLNDEQESSYGRPSSILSDRSLLEPIVKDIRNRKKEKFSRRVAVNDSKKVTPIMFDYQKLDEEQLNDLFSKGVQVMPFQKSQWVQTEKKEHEDVEAMKLKYQEMIIAIEKKSKYQIMNIRQREEDSLKELHLRQIKLAELTTAADAYDQKLLIYATKNESLLAFNLTLEKKLFQESNMVKYLKGELDQQQEYFGLKLNQAVQANIEKNAQLKKEIETLNYRIQAKEKEIVDLKILYHREVDERSDDCENARIELEEEKQQSKQQLIKLEEELVAQRDKEILLLNQIKTLNEFIRSRPSKTEDVTTIEELQREGQKLEKSLQENHRLIMHANEIVKYLQMELNNYKEVYNIFQSDKKTQQNEAQLNIENMRKQIFDLAYQKQFIKMLELQKILNQEEDIKKNNFSFRPNTSQSQQKTTIISFNKRNSPDCLQINNLPKITDRGENTNLSITKLYQSNKEKKLPLELKALNQTQNYDMYQTQSSRRQQQEKQKRFSNPTNFYKITDEQKLKKNKAGPRFHNPYEDDNILLHADRFVKSLLQNPQEKKKPLLNQDQKDINKVKTYSDLVDNQQFKQISDFKLYVQNHELQQ